MSELAIKSDQQKDEPSAQEAWLVDRDEKLVNHLETFTAGPNDGVLLASSEFDDLIRLARDGIGVKEKDEQISKLTEETEQLDELVMQARTVLGAISMQKTVIQVDALIIRKETLNQVEDFLEASDEV